MSKEAKTVTGLVIVALLALGTLVTMGMLVALGVLVAGGLGVAAVFQRDDMTPTKLRSRNSKRETTDLLHSATSTVEPLTTWTPPDSLKPWSPSADTTAPAPPSDLTSAPSTPSADQDFWSPTSPSVSDFKDLAEPPHVAEPTDWAQSTDWAEPTDWAETTSTESPEAAPTAAPAPSSWLDDPFGATDGTDQRQSDGWADGSTWDDSTITADSNPLDDLARLDDIDVIAEFERLDERETLGQPGFDQALSPINEAVSSADDIMAASQATELQVQQDNDDNSELAKLLAKVQARLAAYE